VFEKKPNMKISVDKGNLDLNADIIMEEVVE
jgi:hypothetical protein